LLFGKYTESLQIYKSYFSTPDLDFLHLANQISLIGHLSMLYTLKTSFVFTNAAVNYIF